MGERREHGFIKRVKQNFAEGRIDKREFLRTSTLLGLTATAAYAFVGKVTGESFVRPARADMPMGGTMRVAMRTISLKNPHTFSWIIDSNAIRGTVDWLTRTGVDNITRPSLVERWEASDDLKTWTFHLRQGIKWRKTDRDFSADDAIWNIKHCLDDNTGSSVQGLMKGYMLADYDTGEKDESGNPKMGTQLWDASAIERVDDYTFRLNCKVAQLAVPEHMFHYPFGMLDPEEGGEGGAGMNGTGPFDLVEYNVGSYGKLVKVRPHWSGVGPYLDTIEIIDTGDDPAAKIGALASKQVHFTDGNDILQLPAFQNMPHVQIQSSQTAETAVARMRRGTTPLADDPRVVKAMRMSVDSSAILNLAHAGLGGAGEHHHVCPIHPEYAQLTAWTRDVEGAKALLAEAGHPDGIDLEIATKADPPWELSAVQGMVEQWKDAGIRVAINVMPSAQFWEIWDKAPFGFTSWAHRPLGFMVLGLAYRTGVPWNEANWSNAKFDELLTKAEGTLDVEARRAIMAELETIMQEEGPIIQPVWRATYIPSDKAVLGLESHPTGYYFWETYAIQA